MDRDRKINNRYILERFKFVVLIIVMILCNIYIVRFAVVYGESMEPTLSSKDWVLVWQLGYKPSPGDIVITDCDNEFSQNLVKRVIGIGGQKLQISGQQIFVDGVLLDEPYLIKSYDYPSMNITIPEDHSFVMGDNRDYSKDSRDFGCIPNMNVKGKVIMRFFPLKQMCLFDLI